MRKEITFEGAHGTLKQWVIFNALLFIGFIGFIILAGDEDPQKPMSLAMWLSVKAFGAAVIITCWFVGRWLNAKGLFPNFEDMED